MNELFSRAGAIARVDLAHEPDFKLGPVRVRPALRGIVGDSWRETLEPRVMQVLVALARAKGEVVSRDDLIAACWEGRVVGDDAISRCISRLHRLAAASSGAFQIETIPRVGYRLIGAGKTDAGPELTGRSTGPNGALSPPGRRSICVLPFSNMSSDTEQEYFSDGISEDIITDLSKVSALSVVARNTAFQFKGKSVDARRIARELNVSHLLEGSVRKSGNRVRITAQLIDGNAGDSIWTERYDRNLTDIFDLQDEITRAIIAALRVKLLPEEKREIERRGTKSADAYSLYLQARRSYVTSNMGDRRQHESIASLCRRATDIDQNFAQAWALLGLVQWRRSALEGGKAAEEEGLAAAERAIALDPELAAAHCAKARFLGDRGAENDALAEIKIALRLEPESYEANNTAAWISRRLNQLKEAARYFERAASLMESDYDSVANLLSCCNAIGDTEGAKRAAHLGLARCEAALDHDHADGGALAYMAYLLAYLGERKQAREWIARTLQIDPDNFPARFLLGCTFVLLHDIEGALGMLGPLLQKSSLSVFHHFQCDPDLNPLRNDARFRAMMAATETRLAAT